MNILNPKPFTLDQVYAPEFIIKGIRQSTPFPGQLNTLTISLATNIVLNPPAAITMAGFAQAGATLGETGALTLAAGAETCPADTLNGFNHTCGAGGPLFRGFPSADHVDASDSQGYFDPASGRIVLYSHAAMTPGTLYTFTFTLRNPVCVDPQIRPCIRANRIAENSYIPNTKRQTPDPNPETRNTKPKTNNTAP